MTQPKSEGTGAPAVRAERLGTVALLILDAGPGNPAGARLRRDLAAGLEAALADPAVTGIVVLGEGPDFSTGADLAEGVLPEAPPSLRDLCLRIETADKPVVAALHGAVLDAGADLALAAQARVAEAGVRLGFPGIGRGMPPGGGATQRLPRRVGAAVALDLLLTGRTIPAGEALATGLVDRVVEGQDALMEAALGLAGALAGLPPPPPGGRGPGPGDVAAGLAAVARARAGLTAGGSGVELPAPARIAACVEAALLLPFDQGLAFEAAAEADLAATDAAAALTAIARAEVRLAMPPAQAVRPPRAAAVLGAEGAGIAEALLAAGLAVTLADPDRTALVAALARIAAGQEAAVEEGRLDPAARDADWARLTPALEPPAETPLLILSGSFAEAGAALPPVAAGLVVTLGRAGVGGPAAAGLILSPKGRLAEVLTGAATAPATKAALAALLRRMGRLPVETRGRGIAGPVRAALSAAARHLAARAGRAPVVAALEGLGSGDLAADLPDGPGPALPAAIAARLRGAAANAGFRLLGEGAADRPGDIDAALVHGAGWPRAVPGPMLWSAMRGLIVLRADLRAWAAEAPEIWTPAPMIDAMIRTGARLSDIDG